MNQQTKWQASLEALCQNSSGQVTLSFYDEKLRHGFSVGGSCAVLSASTIKLLVLAEVFRQAEEGSLSLAEGVTLTAEKRTGGDGILKELLPGHTFTLKELCTLMIIVSDNEAANLLLDRVGMDKVNQLGEDLGLTATHLGRKMMDSAARDAGRDNWTCADDLVLLLRGIYEGTLVSPHASKTMLEMLKRQQQGDRLQRYLPEDVPLAHKCGDLKGVENDCGIFLLPDHPYILAVLTQQQPDSLTGKRTLGTLGKLVYDHITEGEA